MCKTITLAINVYYTQTKGDQWKCSINLWEFPNHTNSRELLYPRGQSLFNKLVGTRPTHKPLQSTKNNTCAIKIIVAFLGSLHESGVEYSSATRSPQISYFWSKICCSCSGSRIHYELHRIISLCSHKIGPWNQSVP